jgi:hypothetical protein
MVSLTHGSSATDGTKLCYTLCSWQPSPEDPVEIDVPMQPDGIAFEAPGRLVIVNTALSSVSWLDCESKRIGVL